MERAITLITAQGAAMAPWLEAVAQLRIELFRHWPYLYDGDIHYETQYLSHYAQSKDAVLVLACDGDTVVGCATGLPLEDDDAPFQAPFLANNLPVASIYYIGELLLRPSHQGMGIGHRFFDVLEAHATGLQRFDRLAFATVDRSACDPRKPDDARDLTAFWERRGYVKQNHLQMRFAWKQVNEFEESDQSMTFWTRALSAAIDAHSTHVQPKGSETLIVV